MRSLRDARYLGEALAVIVVTWLALGYYFDQAITQSDGSVFVVPYTHSALAGGFDWTHHLYRFGVLGGSSMHDFAGTLPIVQLCALVGLSTTTTVNLVTIVIQLCFAFFGIVAIGALRATWGGRDRELSAPQRVIATWACAFAPLLGWRLAIGHENLLLGLLPFVAVTSAWWCARAGRLSGTCLVMLALAIWHGIASLGMQTAIYSAVFGAPIALAIAWAPPGARWSRGHLLVVVVAIGGVLLALPRFAGMVGYATGDDSARTLDAHLTYAFGTAGWRDWVGSVLWTAHGSRAWFGDGLVHEHNFPLGPLVVIMLAAWPRTAPRRLLVALGVATLLALGFAGDVPPISDALLAIARPLGAFRVPARAIMPILVLVPPLALAALWSRNEAALEPLAPRLRWLALAIALGAIALVSHHAAWLREPLGWLGCVAIVAIARWRPRWSFAIDALLPVVAALGVCAFAERFPRGFPNDPIEHGPAALRDAVLAQAPELAMPLDRVEITDAPLPYAMSTAFAAGLGSLDGDFNPPRRYLELIAAASGRAVPPETVVFQLLHDRSFPILQQLYDVRYVVSVARGSVEALPPTPGPAWFPARVETAADPAAVVRALGHDVHTNASQIGWLLARDRVPAVPTTCAGARVDRATTDAIGQRATFAVTVPAGECVLVVSTTYVSTLRATAGERELVVFPIDVALTGIVVPRGAELVVLAPVARIPWWTRVAWWIGILVIAGAIVARARQR